MITASLTYFFQIFLRIESFWTDIKKFYLPKLIFKEEQSTDFDIFQKKHCVVS